MSSLFAQVIPLVKSMVRTNMPRVLTAWSVFFRECYYTLLNYFGQQMRFSGRKFCFKNAVHALAPTIITLCAEVHDRAYPF